MKQTVGSAHPTKKGLSMFDNEIVLHKFMLGYVRMLLSDVPEEEMDQQSIAGGNPPRWILTHLAICTDYAARALGSDLRCPKDWHKTYGPGSSPGAKLETVPSKDELLAALSAGVDRVNELAASADPSKLGGPHGLAILATSPIQTVQQFVAHLMTTHIAGHVGQLSAWRRAMGRSPLF